VESPGEQVSALGAMTVAETNKGQQVENPSLATRERATLSAKSIREAVISLYQVGILLGQADSQEERMWMGEPKK
jgi:hypothetical protein